MIFTRGTYCTTSGLAEIQDGGQCVAEPEFCLVLCQRIAGIAIFASNLFVIDVVELFNDLQNNEHPFFSKWPPKWQQNISSQYTSYFEAVILREPHNIEFGNIYDELEYEENHILENSVSGYL